MQNDHRPAIRNPVFRLLHWFAECARRSRERHDLAQLDDRMLSDIGITRVDAEREIEKPFWKREGEDVSVSSRAPERRPRSAAGVRPAPIRCT